LPHSKQAQKQARNSEKRRMRNRAVRSRTKTFVTRAERLVFAGDMEAARTAVVESISALDKAAEKGIIQREGQIALFHSPIICSRTCLDLGRLSKSTTTICCHVPRASFPLLKGTASDAPSSEARTWE